MSCMQGMQGLMQQLCQSNESSVIGLSGRRKRTQGHGQIVGHARLGRQLAAVGLIGLGEERNCRGDLPQVHLQKMAVAGGSASGQGRL